MDASNQCSTIQSCLPMGRIKKCLKFYQTLNNENKYDLLIQYFSDDYPFLLLLNDFNHILTVHICSDAQNIYESKKNFNLMYDNIIKEIGNDGCDVQKCKRFERQNRNRENEKLNVTTNKNNNNIHSSYNLLELYVDTLDTIHCCIIHSVDNGFRLLINEQKVDEDDINCIDNEMKRIQSILDEKRKLLSKTNANNRFKNNKFMTKAIVPYSSDDNEAVLFIDSVLLYLLKTGISASDVDKLNAFLLENEYDTDSINDDIYNNEDDDSNIFVHCNNKIFFNKIGQYIIKQKNDDAEHNGSYCFGFRYYYW
eukprot:5498_1